MLVVDERHRNRKMSFTSSNIRYPVHHHMHRVIKIIKLECWQLKCQFARRDGRPILCCFDHGSSYILESSVSETCMPA